jgi:arylsulfatase A-like enzyme
MEGKRLRYYLYVLVALGLGLLGLARAAHGVQKHASRAAQNPPNIVVIVADDMGWEDCQPSGHPRLKTPALKLLAEQGMRFNRAFLSSTACGPSRASILTGRYPHATAAGGPHPPLPSQQEMLSQTLRKAGYYAAAAGKWYLDPAAKAQFDVVQEGGGAGGYRDWLPVLRNRPRGKRFFLWLASSDPHRPYVPRATADPFPPQEVLVPPYLPDVEEIRNDLACYYNAITRLDTHVAQVLDELARQGEAGNTLVLFISDNGRPFPRCKSTLYDSGIRTPLLIRWPGRVKPGTTTESLVSAVDVAPTILDLAGLTPPPSCQGKSFSALLRDPHAEIHRHVFAAHNSDDYTAFQRGLRSSGYAYIRNEAPQFAATPAAEIVRSASFQAMRRLRDAGKLSPPQMACFVKPSAAEELYELTSDPQQLKNLAGDPQHARALDEMRRALDQWRTETGDVRPEQLPPDKYDRETGLGVSVAERVVPGNEKPEKSRKVRK